MTATRPAVVFPDAVQIVTSWLTTQLSVPVGHRVPNPRPDSFVRVFRSGGVANGVIDRAQVVVESWALTDAAAQDLAQLARFHMTALAGETVGAAVVYRVDEVSGPTDLPDPDSDQSRFTFTVVVHVRGTTP